VFSRNTLHARRGGGIDNTSEFPAATPKVLRVRFGFRPVAFRNVMTVASNFESRSRIT
jgi:hypothetical protein